MNIEKIGNVTLNYQYYKGVDQYSDGDIEDVILEIVKNNENYLESIADNNSWAILYHLSPEREVITGVMNISKNDELLEIGAGCGAITGALSRRAKSVDCIELSKKRAEIDAYRNKNLNNITISVGNFMDIQFQRKYDVITLIGVLEYSANYINASNPFVALLLKIRELMKDNGRLYIAIENKLGLKYFAGCKEDHTNILFDGIENYKSGSEIRTFSRYELEKMIIESGFNKYNFYYPYPDYKLPFVIFSDEYPPKKTDLILNSKKNFDSDRYILFDEGRAFESILVANEFKTFSNSYLIEVIK